MLKSKLESTVKYRAANAWEFIRFFGKWVGIAALIGIVGGFVGSLFYSSVVMATDARNAAPWLVYFLPLAGLIIAGMYKVLNLEGENTNGIIDAILLGRNVPYALTPAIFGATVLTHLFGGSAGREGAALQIGGSIGCNVGKIVKLDEKEERLAVLAGMSAVFSALFGTPIAAIVFALEVCSVGIIHYSGLVPCGVASLVAFGITRLCGIAPTRFAMVAAERGMPLLLKVVVLAVLCAALSVVFCRIMHASGKIASRTVGNPFLRAFLGGLVLVALTVLVGNNDYNGGGVDVIVRAVEQGEADIPAFAWKMLFTAITLGCGFKGGEIVPTFFIGATFGCVIGPLLGIPAGFAAAIGLAATFCGAVNCPLTSVILATELFGSEYIVYFASACFIAYMLSGYTSLYEEQKIIYSKLKAEYINIKAE